MMSDCFYFQPTLNRLFNSCIKLYWHKISFSWNMKGMGQTDHPHLLHQKKLLSKSPALLGLKWKLALGSFCCRSREIRLCLLFFLIGWFMTIYLHKLMKILCFLLAAKLKISNKIKNVLAFVNNTFPWT